MSTNIDNISSIKKYLIGVCTLMDNDIFNQAVEGSSAQFRDVGAFLSDFYPLTGVIRKLDSSAESYQKFNGILLFVIVIRSQHCKKSI